VIRVACFCGQVFEVELTPNGSATCPDCAEPIYISPAPRARELAEKMAAPFQLEPEIDALPEVER
jgi:hypothetical protein